MDSANYVTLVAPFRGLTHLQEGKVGESLVPWAWCNLKMANIFRMNNILCIVQPTTHLTLCVYGSLARCLFCHPFYHMRKRSPLFHTASNKSWAGPGNEASTLEEPDRWTKNVVCNKSNGVPFCTVFVVYINTLQQWVFTENDVHILSYSASSIIGWPMAALLLWSTLSRQQSLSRNYSKSCSDCDQFLVTGLIFARLNSISVMIATH